MKIVFLLSFICITSVFAFTAKGEPLRYESYDVLFTNPTCKEYLYQNPTPVLSNAGVQLFGKPKDAYCTASDAEASAVRSSSPQYKLIEWIRDPQTTEIFFTYFSFSNNAVKQELCKAVEERNVKITFVIDSQSDTARANELVACKPANGDENFVPKVYLRGHIGGLGLAHNKFFIVNPYSATMGLVFSSGNLTSGAVLHHENWHFIRLPTDTYFAKSHLCAMDAEINSANSRAEYGAAVTACRAQSGFTEESDIKVFFIPGDGRAAPTLIEAVQAATHVQIAAHRFSFKNLIEALGSVLAKPVPTNVNLITDDDIWWAGHDVRGLNNTKDEWNHVVGLQNLGLAARYVETNHKVPYLHHNKFAIFTMPDPILSSVFAGAGNFTGAGFRENLENYYYIRIPKVFEAFKTQYEYLWNLSTAEENLPNQNVLPQL